MKMISVENKSCPLVSIVIPNYNGGLFFERLFQSLGTQTFRKFEVIVVDNHSTDGSNRILKDVARRYLPDIAVKLLENDRNYGYSVANNRGIAESKGDLILFLNNDTYVSPTWLEELVKVLENNPMVAACGSKIIDAKTGLLQTAGELLDQYGWVGSLLNVEKQQNVIVDKFFYPSFVSVIFKKNVLESCGAFDKNLFITGDYDFGWRVRLLGFSFASSMTSICHHYGSFTVKKFGETTRHYLLYKEKIYVLLKNFSFSNLIRRFPTAFLLMLSSSAYKSLKFKQPYLLTLFSALLWNLKNFREVWVEREKVQYSRKFSDRYIELYMSRCFFIISNRNLIKNI